MIPAQRWRDPGANCVAETCRKRRVEPGAAHGRDGARRARRHPAHVHPHVMRHAFGDHVARHAGIKKAQALLGHADVGTTQVYTGAPTLDELAAAIEGLRFARQTN